MLDEAGSRLEDISKVITYATDPRNREAFCRVVGEWLKGIYPVPRNWPRPKWAVEIDFITVIRTSPLALTFSILVRDASGSFGAARASRSGQMDALK